MQIRHLALLSILGFVTILLLLFPAQAGAACVPDVIVSTGGDIRSNVTIDACGSVNITASGSATWTDVTILFNSSAADGHGLYIDGSATFVRVNISAPAGAAPYVVQMNTGSVVTVEGSDFSGMSGTATDPGPSGRAEGTQLSTLVGGVQIYSKDVRIGNSTIHDGWGVLVYVSVSVGVPRINNNVIRDPIYLTFEYATSFGGSTQTSQYRAVAACVVLASGNTDFDTNRVEKCGGDASANATDLGTQNATIAVSNFQLVGAGVVVLGGVPSFRQGVIQTIVSLNAPTKSFVLGNVSVTHNFFKLASWGLLFKNAPGVVTSGGYVHDADTGVEIIGNASYSAGVPLNYDFFLLNVNGTYLRGIEANFGGMSQTVTLTFSSVNFASGGSSALAVRFTAMTAAHTVSVAGGTTDLNGGGTGIALEDADSSGRPTFSVGYATITRTREPISVYLARLTGGALVSVHNNSLDQTSGLINSSLFNPQTRGGIDVRAEFLSSSPYTLLVEDNRVYNQSWQLGSPYPGLTLYQVGASGVIESLAVRRNVISNVSYGMYIYEDFQGFAQSSTYAITQNVVEVSSTYGGYFFVTSGGGTVDPSFDGNKFDRCNGYAFYWYLEQGFVNSRIFANNTVLGTSVAASTGFAFLFTNPVKWPLTLVDSFIFQASIGLTFQQVIANVMRANLTATGTGVSCSSCVALLEDTDIYPLSATVSGTNAEVTVLQRFTAPRVQWQGDGGLLIHDTKLFLRWYGPTSTQTLATVVLDYTGAVAPRAVATWKRATPNLQELYANITPVVPVDAVDIFGIPVNFATPFYGNLTILDPELPTLSFSTPSRDTQLRVAAVTVKGNANDPTTGIETVQISFDGVNFTNVTTYDGQTGVWNHTLAFPGDGTYDITIHAWDRARWSVTFGNLSAGFREVVIVGIVVDTVPPFVVIDVPPVDITTNVRNLQITGRALDTNPIDTFQVAFNGVDLGITRDAGGNFQRQLPALTEGPNLISVLATDRAGNTNLYTRTVTLDTVPPFLLVRSPQNNSFVNRPSIQIAGEVEAGVVVKVNGLIAVLPYSYTLNSGENRIWINATDAGLNNASYLLVVVLDRTPPTLTFTEPARFPVSTNNPRVVLVGRANEPLMSVEVNNVSYPLSTPLTFSIELYLEDGSHFLTVRVTDLANNSYEVFPSPSIVVDTAPPTLRIDAPGERSIQSSRNILIRGHTDTNAFVNVTTPSGLFPLNVNPLTGEFTLEDTRSSDGVFVYQFRASDGVGNAIATSVQITVDTTPPSIEVLGVGNNEQTTNEYIRLHGTVSAGSRITVNGAPVATDCPTIPNVDCVYEFLYPLEPGTNTITIQATDGAGNQGLRSVFVKRDPAPVPPAPPQFGPFFLIGAIAVGALMLPVWLRKSRAGAARDHPGLDLGAAPAAQPVAQQAQDVVYEQDPQDMYAADFRPRSPRAPRPPQGGM